MITGGVSGGACFLLIVLYKWPCQYYTKQVFFEYYTIAMQTPGIRVAFFEKVVDKYNRK